MADHDTDCKHGIPILLDCPDCEASLSDPFGAYGVDVTPRPFEAGAKPSNPKDAIASMTKAPWSVLSMNVIWRIALAMLEGALKYSRHNYRVVGVRASVYIDATGRHLAQFWEGQDLDPDSKIGLHHLDKAMASLAVLRDSILRGNWVDDRPPRTDDKWITEVNDMAAALVKAFPNPPGPCTQSGIDEAVKRGEEYVIPTKRKE
jgi:hypothetical protein